MSFVVRRCLVGVLCVALAGCITRPNPELTNEQMRAVPMASEVWLAPDDVIEFKFFYNPELNEVQTVRPDGKVMLQLVGEIEAQGKTPKQLADELEQRYAAVLKNPEVAVVCRNLPSRRIFVGGEVVAPGPIDMQGAMTALEAIMYAGGFEVETAEPKNVVVIRDTPDGRTGTLLDLQKALEGKSTDAFYLHPHDVVFVPQSIIADANQWIEQHINRMMPEVGVRYSRPLDKGTIQYDYVGNR